MFWMFLHVFTSSVDCRFLIHKCDSLLQCSRLGGSLEGSVGPSKTGHDSMGVRNGHEMTQTDRRGRNMKKWLRLVLGSEGCPSSDLSADRRRSIGLRAAQPARATYEATPELI